MQIEYVYVCAYSLTQMVKWNVGNKEDGVKS